VTPVLLDYYNLREQPFGVTPDPRYLYASPTHREALASLSYGIQSGRGFMSIIAQPGMGKTTILFQLLERLQGSTRTVFLFQNFCRPQDLLRSLLLNLGVDEDGGDIVRMQVRLNDLLLAEARKERKVVVVIDEAQNLEDSALELVRMLSNFETASDKMMQIILAGQPQLRDKLASPHLLQLRQRMSIFARLQPFSTEETRFYVDHRLRVAGYNFEQPLFTPEAWALIAKYGEGIPRNINNICFNALSLGFVLKQKSIQADVVRETLADLALDAGGANQPEEGPVVGKVVALTNQLTKPSDRPWAWRKRLAISAMLILPALWFSVGRQRPKAAGSLLAPVLGVTSRMDAKQSVPGAAVLRNSSAPPVDGGPRRETEMPAVASTGDIPKVARAISPPPREQSRRQPRPILAQTSEPDKLWAQVRKQNIDAEVELARMYLEGTAVPQNCAQAQVLLLAASQKGNAHASDLLSNYKDRCR
jgi:type II secretory pathway predicted ATPase ExeA